MKKTALAALAILTPITLAGCETYDPYTGERKVSNTAKGAGLGALAGGAIGAIAGDDEAAFAGAAAGALLGGGYGAYMDRQEAELRRELAQTGVQIQRNGENINLVMPGAITFDTNQSSVRSQFYPALNDVAQVLQKYNETNITVAGYTDSTGSDQYNTNLSIARAEAVGNYLVAQGVNVGRINALGYGETNPVASNATEQGRAQNRRVEITVSPQAGA